MVQDELVRDLRRQMLTATAQDRAGADLLRRVQGGQRRHRRQRVGLAGVAAVALVAGTVGGVAVLDRPAGQDAILAQPGDGGKGVLLGPSDAALRSATWFRYDTTSSQNSSAVSTWQGRDGSYVIPVPGGGHQRIPASGGVPEQSALLAGPTFAEVQKLPADSALLPAALHKYFASGPTQADDHQLVLNAATEVLSSGPALLPVRVALLQLVRADPGTTSAAGPDVLARSGLVLSRPAKDDIRLELVVDVASARVLEERQVQGGAVLVRTTFVSWSTEAPPAAYGK